MSPSVCAPVMHVAPLRYHLRDHLRGHYKLGITPCELRWLFRKQEKRMQQIVSQPRKTGL